MTYSDEFKQDFAIFLYNHPNTPQNACARFLGLSESTVRDFFKQYYGVNPSRKRKHLDFFFESNLYEKEVILQALLKQTEQDALEFLIRHPDVKTKIPIDVIVEYKNKNAKTDDIELPEVTASDLNAEHNIEEKNTPEEIPKTPSGAIHKFFDFFSRLLH